MAPINADVAEVEAQLSAIRSRRNGLVTQRALAGALSVALLAAALVVATALRASQTVFVVAVTLAAATSLAAIGYAIWRTRGDWLSLSATAHLADVHAALEERLTTLLAIARTNPRPALSGLLISQIVGARDRWGVEALAPRRLSPWLALVPLSILIFGATAFYARPPGAIGGNKMRLTPPSIPARPLGGSAAEQQSQDGLFAPGDGALAMTSGAHGDTGGAAAASNDQLSATAASPSDEGSKMMATADGGTAPGEVGAESGLANLRRSIRETFGADQEGARAAEGKDRKGHGNAGADRDSGSGDAAKQPQQAAAGVGEAKGEQSDSRSASNQSVTPNPGRNTADQGARGSGRGGAGTAGSTSVLGANGSQRIEPDASAAVALKLKAISGVSPSQNEPQRRSEGMPAAATRAAKSSDHPLPDLAGEQVADVTMQQPDIGPEHEAVVRRLFSRE